MLGAVISRIHVDDLARIVVKLCEIGPGVAPGIGFWNAADDVPAKSQDVIQCIYKKLNKLADIGEGGKSGGNLRLEIVKSKKRGGEKGVFNGKIKQILGKEGLVYRSYEEGVEGEIQSLFSQQKF